MRWFPLIAAACFFLIGAEALLAHPHGFALHSSPCAASIAPGDCPLCFALRWRSLDLRQTTGSFEQWLCENQTAVLGNGARFEGIWINGETEIARFQLTIGLLVLTLRLPSRILVEGRDSFRAPRLAYSLGTLLLGWWGLPWGPVCTLRDLASNLSGGHRMTVREYLSTRQV